MSLYKIGDAYFVRDGNHRVSVARYHGVATIDAEVVEIRGHTHSAGTPAPRPQHAPEPGTSPLHDLWRRLRPGLWRPAARPAS